METIKSVFLLLFVSIISSIGLIAQEAKVLDSTSPDTKTEIEKPGPKASWDTTSFDLGEIIYKAKKKAEFTLSNTGNQPLFIVFGQTSCGCAHLDYSEAPILPGKSIIVTVTYHGTDLGEFMKTISMVTNADTDRTVLQVKGKVVEE